MNLELMIPSEQPSYYVVAAPNVPTFTPTHDCYRAVPFLLAAVRTGPIRFDHFDLSSPS